jgi:hypothetical protein
VPIVREIAELHAARISLNRSQPHGLRVRLDFPPPAAA